MGKQEIHLVVALSTLALSGCNSNLYSTPRTVPIGQTQHIVGVGILPEMNSPLPTMVYIVRRGLTDRVDIGFQVSSVFKVDLKVNAVRTKYFDLALDPAISAGLFPLKDGSVLFPGFDGTLPVLMGLNLGKRLTFVAQGGLGLAIHGGIAAYPIVGGGLQVRLGDLVMIQPNLVCNSWKMKDHGQSRGHVWVLDSVSDASRDMVSCQLANRDDLPWPLGEERHS